MKRLLTAVSAVVLFSVPSWGAGTAEQPDRNIEVYNLERPNLGLKGYDPVSYFPEAGGDAERGSSSIAGEYGGVVYHFASVSNRELFFDNPSRYEPTYGGWCAWAMANDSFADIDPLLYTMHGNRSHFFISRGAKARFDRNVAKYEKLADGFWNGKSGEVPRDVPRK